MSDRSSWLRLLPLMPPAAASMPVPEVLAETTVACWYECVQQARNGGLQVLLPLRTHHFFRGFGVTEVSSQTGREEGFKGV